MKNKFFTTLLTGFFAIVFLFIVSPLLMLIIKGISYVPICLKSVEVQYAITLSIKTSLISTIVCLLLAIPVAYFLHITKLPFKKLIIQIINLPMSLPHLVSGIALLLCLEEWGLEIPFIRFLSLILYLQSKV
nr:hypothetical protein [Clostridioides difficile]